MVKYDKNLSGFEKSAVRFTEWVGSGASLAVHTLGFLACFVLVWFGVDIEKVLLVLTTAVSLEAIYLAIFIQMTVNRNTASLEEVEEDIDEIQKDVDEIQEDVDEIEKDIDEVQKDVDEIQEDVEEFAEEETADEVKSRLTHESLAKIESSLSKLMEEIERLKTGR